MSKKVTIDIRDLEQLARSLFKNACNSYGDMENIAVELFLVGVEEKQLPPVSILGHSNRGPGLVVERPLMSQPQQFQQRSLFDEFHNSIEAEQAEQARNAESRL